VRHEVKSKQDRIHGHYISSACRQKAKNMV